jgi:hypothetical protein
MAIRGVPLGWEQVPVKAGIGRSEMKKMSAPPIPRRAFFSGDSVANFFILEAPKPTRAIPIPVYITTVLPVIIPSVMCMISPT